MNSLKRKDDPNTVHDIGQIYELQMLIIILSLFKDVFSPKTKTLHINLGIVLLKDLRKT